MVSEKTDDAEDVVLWNKNLNRNLSKISVSAVANGGSRRPKGCWEEQVRRRPAIVFTFLRPALAITNISLRVITVSIQT